MYFRHILKASVGFTLFLGVSSFAHAGVIFDIEGPGIMSSQVDGATTINFEGSIGKICSGYTSCTGDYLVRNTPQSGLSANPFQTPAGENWLSVPDDRSSGSASFGLDSNYDYFGLYWGSIDTYNTINFYDDSSLIASFTGGDLQPPLLAQGSWTNVNSNRFINFFFNDGDTYNTVELVSTRYAFETDNHAYGNVSSVPEPSVLALFGLGIAGLGFSRRRK